LLLDGHYSDWKSWVSRVPMVYRLRVYAEAFSVEAFSSLAVFAGSETRKLKGRCSWIWRIGDERDLRDSLVLGRL
jgi:hypothetical protein